MIGAVMQAYIIGEISSQQAEMGKDDVEFQQKIDLTNTAMANLKIDKILRNNVSDYIQNTHQTLKK